MQTIGVVARVLLGAMFTVLGLNGFLDFLPGPTTVPAAAGAFLAATNTYRWRWSFLQRYR